MTMKKILKFGCVLMAALSINVASVSAANTTDKPYEYTAGNNQFWHETTHYEKTDPSKVYVKPSKSPSGKTSVQTYCYDHGNKTNKTQAGTVTLTSGKAYAITNYVFEQGDKTGNYVYMWLRVKPTDKIGVTNGVWSPDWTGYNATVV